MQVREREYLPESLDSLQSRAYYGDQLGASNVRVRQNRPIVQAVQHPYDGDECQASGYMLRVRVSCVSWVDF
ncbi:MAG: hypothetical protein LZF60_260015 [Nitrospira sp.]|nr:MAG: hypothetical protein LZF60_260015 [Nitrospira sp.]